NADVALQWHHQPLAAHEPAASAEARLAECAAEAGGHAAFWQAVEWVYAHTRSDGLGLPDGLRYPESTPA
ncbi:disulfide bond formation protein DsbA, partial [Pseudomonas aeruginosa]